MKYMLFVMIISALWWPLQAQTTITNIDDDTIVNEPLPYPNPQAYNNNLNEWAWNAGPGIGCVGCNAGGNMSHTNLYSVDGQSLQMNLVNINGYPNVTDCYSNCYADVLYSNRICLVNYCGATQSTYYQTANYFTLDLHATTDDSGLSYSQALEFVIQQDAPDPNISGDYDPYSFGFQCDYKGSDTDLRPGKGQVYQHVWRVWWGNYVNSGGKLGAWTVAIDTSGNPISCDPITATEFSRFIFHFERVNNSSCASCTKYIDFTIVLPDGTSEYYPLDPSMIFGINSPQSGQPGLNTWMQLDGDSAENAYSVWGDEWNVCYAQSSGSDPCS